MQNPISNLSPETLSEKILEALNNGKNLESIRQQYIQDGGSQLTWLRALEFLNQDLTDDTSKAKKDDSFYGKIAFRFLIFSIFFIIGSFILLGFSKLGDYATIIALFFIFFVIIILMAINIIYILRALISDKTKNKALTSLYIFLGFLLLSYFYFTIFDGQDKIIESANNQVPGFNFECQNYPYCTDKTCEELGGKVHVLTRTKCPPKTKYYWTNPEDLCKSCGCCIPVY